MFFVALDLDIILKRLKGIAMLSIFMAFVAFQKL